MSHVLSDSVKSLGLWAGILARRKLDYVTRPILWMSLPSTFLYQTIFKADGIVGVKGHLVVLLFFPFLLLLQTREQLLIYIALKYHNTMENCKWGRIDQYHSNWLCITAFVIRMKNYISLSNKDFRFKLHCYSEALLFHKYWSILSIIKLEVHSFSPVFDREFQSELGRSK